MKKQLVLFIILIGFISCKKDSKTKETVVDEIKDEKANTSSETNMVNFTIDIDKSTVKWIGSKKLSSHDGTINLSSGNLLMNNNNIAGGDFVIDMTSIKNTDIKDAEKAKGLEGHLKNADFFDVEKFPNATFKITNFKNDNDDSLVSGDLTIKGITKKITFPAKLNIENNSISFNSNMSFNRVDFGVQYNSGSIFTDLVANKIISDEIKLSINLVGSVK